MTRMPSLLLALLSLSGAAAFAQTPSTSADTSPTPVSDSAGPGRHGPMHEHPMMHGHPFMRILRHLDLATAQRTQIDSIYSAARPQMESLAKSTHENMEDLMSTSPQDPGYSALVDKAKANALAHIKLISDTQAQIYAVLTPEQQAKIPQIVAAEKARLAAAHHKRQAASSHPMLQ